ncbi:hypothetical protein LguiA_021316 [Lonicera macranthoides]
MLFKFKPQILFCLFSLYLNKEGYIESGSIPFHLLTFFHNLFSVKQEYEEIEQACAATTEVPFIILPVIWSIYCFIRTGFVANQ